jgi:hypothetical protein
MLSRQQFYKELKDLTAKCSLFDASTFNLLKRIQDPRTPLSLIQSDWVRWRSDAKVLISDVRKFQERVRREGGTELCRISKGINWDGVLPLMEGVRSRVAFLQQVRHRELVGPEVR